MVDKVLSVSRDGDRVTMVLEVSPGEGLTVYGDSLVPGTEFTVSTGEYEGTGEYAVALTEKALTEEEATETLDGLRKRGQANAPLGEATVTFKTPDGSVRRLWYAVRGVTVPYKLTVTVLTEGGAGR